MSGDQLSEIKILPRTDPRVVQVELANNLLLEFVSGDGLTVTLNQINMSDIQIFQDESGTLKKTESGYFGFTFKYGVLRNTTFLFDQGACYSFDDNDNYSWISDDRVNSFKFEGVTVNIGHLDGYNINVDLIFDTPESLHT